MECHPKVDEDDYVAFAVTPTCSSVSLSFENTCTPPSSLEASRRQSVASSSSGGELLINTSGRTTSPMTPTFAEYSGQAHRAGPHIVLDMPRYNEQIAGGSWDILKPKYQTQMSYLGGSAMSPTAMEESFSPSYYPAEWNAIVRPTANLSFSRGIFEDHGSDDWHNPLFAAGSVSQMNPIVAQKLPRTIAPNETFQCTPTPSQSYGYEPLTPLRFPPPATSILSSSPCQFFSPGDLPPQPEYDDGDPMFRMSPVTPKHAPRAKRSSGRASRPGLERRGNRLKSSGVVKSGMTCDAVIESNKYACEYADCVDKTGRRKMFKRREHAKRHVDTVHNKKRQFTCWVPGCSTGPFTRSDNLNTHLKQTHGKKSNSSRNRYVATLDATSVYYDPDWRGELEENGYPLHRYASSIKAKSKL